MGTGCQSTSHRTPLDDNLSSITTPEPDQTNAGNFRSHWLPAIIELVETSNEHGQFTEASQFLERQKERFDLNDHSSNNTIESRSLAALQTFLHDPILGLELATELEPKNYIESGLKTWILGHMHWTLRDCELAVNELSKFSPVGSVDSRAMSQRIWEILNSWCVYRHQEGDRDQAKSATEWWDLAHLLGSSISPDQKSERYEDWRNAHPHHLASRFPPFQFDSSIQDVPDRIALLLPQSGSLSSAARAIRNGFLSAHLSNIAANRSVEVELFDTEENDIGRLVDQAIAGGVDVIVGPLDKERVRYLIRGDTLDVPIIALNRVPESFIANSTSLQLGLVVEDDVAAISKRLLDMRAKRILLLIGREFWCARASVALKETLQPRVKIVDETFLNDLSDVTEDVAQILLVAQSNTRHNRLQGLVGEIEFNARRRHDVDAVVAFVDYAEFGSLTAAMQYHFAADIPILVAEPTFRNREQQVEYENGTLFTSTPVTLYPNSLAREVLNSFADAEELLPLYAFGIDAYRVAMNIPNLVRGESVFGLTGVLSIQDSGVITRQPVWGIVSQHSLSPAPSISYPSRTQSPSLVTNP